MSALSKPRKINKDWGYEIWMANNEEENYCGKILYIKAGHSTSMHFHAKKHETFYILEGKLELELICTASTKKYKKVLNEGEVFTLERLLPHRLVAKDGDVKFVEVSTFHEDSDSYRVWRNQPSE
jgi:quercetin dioxygenase-like cupin family protein|tara:strand:- start:143 stop:517 length:375 start_codon:yes stop_codon:yes gene_type:complete